MESCGGACATITAAETAEQTYHWLMPASAVGVCCWFVDAAFRLLWFEAVYIRDTFMWF
jgi:hypothetical protein